MGHGWDVLHGFFIDGVFGKNEFFFKELVVLKIGELEGVGEL